MILALSSKIENDYLIVEASGSIADIEDYKLLAKRYCDEIMKYDIKKIIIDESKMKYPNSLVLQRDIVEHYSVGPPEEFRFWKLACVVDRNMIEIAKFWKKGIDYRVRKGITNVIRCLYHHHNPGDHLCTVN